MTDRATDLQMVLGSPEDNNHSFQLPVFSNVMDNNSPGTPRGRPDAFSQVNNELYWQLHPGLHEKATITFGQQVASEKDLEKLLSMNLEATQMLTVKIPFSGIRDPGIPSDVNNAMLSATLQSTVKRPIGPKKLQSAYICSKGDDQPAQDHEFKSPHHNHLDSGEITKIVLGHEEKLLELLISVHKFNVDAYQRYLSQTEQQYSAILWNLMYLSSWTALRVCRAIKLMEARLSDRTYYSTVDIPSSLYSMVASCYRSFVTNNPQRWKLKDDLATEYDNAYKYLFACRDISGRDDSGSELKTKLAQWANKANFTPAMLAHKRIAECQKSCVFALVELLQAKKSGKKVQPQGLQDFEKVIAKNFLLLMTEEVNPVCLHKDPSFSTTAAVILDWNQVDDLMESKHTQTLLGLALEQFTKDLSGLKTLDGLTDTTKPTRGGNNQSIHKTLLGGSPHEESNYSIPNQG